MSLVRKVLRYLRGGVLTISTLIASMTTPGAIVVCVLIGSALLLALLVLLNKRAHKRFIQILRVLFPEGAKRKPSKRRK